MTESIVLKENRLCMLTSEDAVINSKKNRVAGLYYNDTRLMDMYKVGFCEFNEKILGNNIEKNYKHEIYLTNDTFSSNGMEVKQQSIDIRRERIVNDYYIERLTMKNYNEFSVEFTVILDYNISFSDIFEVRSDHSQLDRTIGKEHHEFGILYFYDGLDGKRRYANIALDYPFEEKDNRLHMKVNIKPNEIQQISIAISPNQIDKIDFEYQLYNLENKYKSWIGNHTQIITDNLELNKVFEKSMLDLRLLLTEIEGYQFYAAGVPFFVTLFGRDSIISSLFSLMFNSSIAKSTLELLSLYQAKEINDNNEAEPGKIIHELRLSELPRVGISPFCEYYGSVDSTILYLILAIEYFNWTGDLEFIKKIESSLVQAIEWIDKYGDIDKDGYVEYHRKSNIGLINQGWKDSEFCMVDGDGNLCETPIALCEVQGYVYYAKKQIGKILELVGKKELSLELQDQAAKLKENFNKDFWIEEKKFFAMGLDKNKKLIDSVTSNVGHCLFTGIIEDEKLPIVIKKLMSEEMFSKWGIRTLSTDNPEYNPISYHNGSVWPHDSAFVSYGMKSQGKDQESLAIAKGLFDTTNRFKNRLPELFCGYSKEEREVPVGYPVACKPQAWAAASPFMLLKSILGIQIDAEHKKVYIKPLITGLANEIIIKNMTVGKETLDLKISENRVEILSDTHEFELVQE